MKSKLALFGGLGVLVLVGAFAFTLGPPASHQDADQTANSVIVQGNDLDAVRAAVLEVGGEITHELQIINSVGAEFTSSQLTLLGKDNRVTRLYQDRVVEVAKKPAEDPYITPDSIYPTLIGADALHSEGITGFGVTVAVLDTGVYETGNLNFNDYAWRILANYNAIGDYMDWLGDTVPFGGWYGNDTSGHGTHVSSVALSSGKYEYTIRRDTYYRYHGVAPNANLVMIKAFDSGGAGSYLDVIRGVDWAVANKDLYDIRVLNCSFSASPVSLYWDDPLNQAIMAAWNAGIVVVASAGNRGPDPMTIGVPGNVPYVITVGAVTDNFSTDDPTDNFLCSFSSTGPTVEGFVKPEVVAPGGHMLGKMPTTGEIVREHPEYYDQIGYYFYMSGTSQSAAVVSGVVALMLEENPALTPDQVKYRLMEAARPAMDESNIPIYSVFQQGAGLVNAYDAVNSTADGFANQGLNIDYELADIEHYCGPANQNEDGTFYIMEHESQDDGTAWSGTYSTDAFGQAYLWSDAQGLAYLWSDSLGQAYLWSDAQGLAYLWSDTLDYAYLWSDTYTHEWSGGMTESMSINAWVPQE